MKKYSKLFILLIALFALNQTKMLKAPHGGGGHGGGHGGGGHGGFHGGGHGFHGGYGRYGWGYGPGIYLGLGGDYYDYDDDEDLYYY